MFFLSCLFTFARRSRMVFFTCNTCGESLKKNQVEKHYRQVCRNCEVLTCVDCHKVRLLLTIYYVHM